MSTSTLLSLEEYDQMIAEGAFAPPDNYRKCELIRGVIRDMSPIGPEHAEVVDWLTEWSFAVTPRDKVRVRIQSSTRIPELVSAPEPDVVWAVRKSYRRRHPQPPDVLLLIEVADSSLRYDLGEKSLLYAEAGISDYWVVDLANFQVHVHRDPSPEGYRSIDVHAAGETIAPLHVPDVALQISELFSWS
jgi:Uma2 family endonuclease